tara:strand:+ start:5738 stop:6109 length:372 start_codon:yes stop_codon:yes gene_type:complete
MGKTFETIVPALQEWIAQRHVFFVATAPLATDGHVNCSPKGSDSFRILNDHEVAYLDLTGSGVETIAHVSENERIVIMFCAFEVPTKPCASTVAARSSCQPIQISPNSVSSFRPTLAPAPSFG